jgi:LysR family transcriptional regulator, cys regulon transcriptional activator
MGRAFAESLRMNFQQLRSAREAQRRGFNLTEVAQALHTSQPGVSRQIRELEEELGIELFVRVGKRLTGLTEPGEQVLPVIERLLLEAENLKRAADDFAQAGSGRLRIAATHSQARYALPPAVRDFRTHHPDVSLHLQQGSPQQIARPLATRCWMGPSRWRGWRSSPSSPTSPATPAARTSTKPSRRPSWPRTSC